MFNQFEWQCHPRAEKFLYAFLDEFKAYNKEIAQLESDLYKHTSTRLFDFLDHLILDGSEYLEKQLEQLGFERESTYETALVFSHPGAQFPSVVLRKSHAKELKGIAVKVDSIADFLMVRGKSAYIEGTLYSPYRRALVSHEEAHGLYVIERRGSRSFEPIYMPDTYLEQYLAGKEKWQTRPRAIDDERSALNTAIHCAQELVANLGKDNAAYCILECERKYWQSRNRAGQIQKNRQDYLGVGWANHDHHTFRSSRAHFPQLVEIFEILGFHCRERYYAGKEAGWGAQIMENPKAGLVVFLDLDLEAHEVEIDFAHHPLPESKALGTIGLWCALHGDSILQAGMHHLEAQFDFSKLKEDLEKWGIGQMKPFSNFSYLHQAFTQGEKWQVNPKRVQLLVDKGVISHHQADQFLMQGALGSHLENLQRKEGYKGFNKDNVSTIIKKTDPRLQ